MVIRGYLPTPQGRYLSGLLGLSRSAHLRSRQSVGFSNSVVVQFELAPLARTAHSLRARGCCLSHYPGLYSPKLLALPGRTGTN